MLWAYYHLVYCQFAVSVVLVLYLNIWATKCSIFIFIEIVNIIIRAYFEQLEAYLEPCQVYMVEIFC